MQATAKKWLCTEVPERTYQNRRTIEKAIEDLILGGLFRFFCLIPLGRRVFWSGIAVSKFNLCSIARVFSSGSAMEQYPNETSFLHVDAHAS
jgi:hypothetical protein